MQIIMAIDYDEEHLREWENILSSCYKLISVRTMMDALKVLKRVNPDMVISELDMPDMNVIEFMRLLQQKEEWRTIPVLVSSGRFDVETERLCFQNGAVEYLHYPIDKTVLLSRVRHSMEVQYVKQYLEAEVLRKSLEIERKNMEMENQRFVVEASRYDTLTGVFSRTEFVERINRYLAAHDCGTFFILDMDNFKAVNDTYGHIEGDRVLKKFAKTLQREAGSKAIVGRLGGDEFTVFLQERIKKQEIRQIASRIVKSVERETLTPRKLIRVTVSVGIANAPEDGRTFEELYNKADKALYFVKKEGKNDYHFFADSGQEVVEKPSTGKTLTDIKRSMGEEMAMNGSYMVDYNSFEKIYHFIERNVLRTQRQVQCVLLTFDDSQENLREEEWQEEMEVLGDVVVKSLRKGDVSTYYSATQLLILLMDTDKECAEVVVERIINQYYRVSNRRGQQLMHEIETVIGETDKVTEVV